MTTISHLGADWDRVASFLAEQLPGRRQLTIQQISEISSGWETDLYVIEIEHSEGHSEGIVLRLYRGPDQQARAIKEHRLMLRMAELGIPVPQSLLLATDNSPLGDAFVVMEHVAGPTLMQNLDEASESEIEGSLHRMTELQAAIHRIAWDGLVEAPDSAPDDFIQQRLTEMQQTVRRYHLTGFDPHMQWLEDRREQGNVRQLSLIHNDYHPENILVRDGELVIIDWAFAEASDFRLDLAWTAMLVGSMLGEQYRPHLLETYEQISGLPVDNFEYFEVLKLTMRMLTIASWMDESVQIPVHKITRQAIRGEYKVHVLNPYRRLKQITGLKLSMIEAL
jgi:aminoglycoside phosphotransferase (APT) family kinase protein